MGYKLIADTEGNGLIPTLTKFHLLGLRDVETRETFVYRNNDVMDNIAEGMEVLAKADTIIGHNWITYDKKAIKKLCPWFKTNAEELDTMVLAKIAKPDIKSSDQALHKRGILPGKLVGSHSLKAWGYRLGKHKGDYAEVMAAKGLDPWAAWNQDMEDYLIGDLDVTEILYHGILSARLPQMTVDFEHEVAEIADQMRDNGFPFDIAGAQALAERLKSETEKLHDECVSFYGRKLVPVKKWVVGPLWDDPDGVNKKKTYKQPREEFGEDHSRAWWGDVVVPKVNHHDKKKGQPYCPAKWVDFNPGSRPQIIDRFVDNHGWKPTEFTEAGNPSVDDAVLKTVAELIPAAKPIAELFFMNKVYAQVATGDQAWIKHYNAETGCVHTTTDTGAAVTGRCAHSHFNIGQVPSVIVGKDKVPLLGREGEFGWECRSLFGVNFGPKKGQHWIQVGIDLSGIEYRCLAELMAPFDDGATIALVLSGQDPHAHNAKLTGIPDRSLCKRILYGLIFGAGDWKLGITANPLLGPDEARKLGAALRAQLMTGLPALDKAIQKVKKEAARGYIIGLDGRKIKVRNDYSALNTRLQSDAALIAKMWMVLSHRNLKSFGANCSWDDDYVQLCMIHDELQFAAYEPFADDLARIVKDSAIEAGLLFNYRCPVNAESKKGLTWADTH